MNENEEVIPTASEEVVAEETVETRVEEADNNAPDAEVIAEEEAKVATGEDFSQPHNAPGMEDHVPADEVSESDALASDELAGAEDEASA